MESESLASTTPNLLHNRSQVYVEASASTQTNAPLTQPDQLFDLLHLSQEHLVQLPAELTEQLTSMVPLHDAEKEEFVSSIKNSVDVCVRVLYGLFLEKGLYGVQQDYFKALDYYHEAFSEDKRYKSYLSSLIEKMKKQADAFSDMSSVDLSDADSSNAIGLLSYARLLENKTVREQFYAYRTSLHTRYVTNNVSLMIAQTKLISLTSKNSIKQDSYKALQIYERAGAIEDFNRLLNKLKTSNDPQDLVVYGQLLTEGKWVEQDYEGALEAYEKAGKQGVEKLSNPLNQLYNSQDVEAFYLLGKILEFKKYDAQKYIYWLSLKNSYVEALAYYKKAGIKGEADFNRLLEKVSTSQAEDLLIAYGNILQAGQWVLKDDEAALSYYAKAGRKGGNHLSNLLGRLRTLNDSNAMQLYGKILEQGLYGVRQDVFEALTYYKKAGERGNRDFKRLAKRIEEDSHPMSLIRYGKLLEKGIVVEKISIKR